MAKHTLLVPGHPSKSFFNKAWLDAYQSLSGVTLSHAQKVVFGYIGFKAIRNLFLKNASIHVRYTKQAPGQRVCCSTGPAYRFLKN